MSLEASIGFYEGIMYPASETGITWEYVKQLKQSPPANRPVHGEMDVEICSKL